MGRRCIEVDHELNHAMKVIRNRLTRKEIIMLSLALDMVAVYPKAMIDEKLLVDISKKISDRLLKKVDDMTNEEELL